MKPTSGRIWNNEWLQKCPQTWHSLCWYQRHQSLRFARFCRLERQGSHQCCQGSRILWILLGFCSRFDFNSYQQREITLRDSLQKFITLHKARSVNLWGWCRMLVEIELLSRGWPHGVPWMPKNLKKVHIYPNLVITPLEVNSLTLHNLHYRTRAIISCSRL